MKWINLPLKPLAKACAAVAVAGGIGAAAPTLLAATLAGTPITNTATVTYEDAAGNVFSATSNQAIVTVAQVYSATLGVDVNTTAPPGQTVYLPYVLTNTGNGTDTFSLDAVNGITGGDAIDSSSITIYHDVDGSGVPEAGEPAITDITVPPNVNNSVNLVVAVAVPGSATDGQTLGITLTADAHEGGPIGIPGTVVDLTAGKGLDGNDSTNESLITVTGDAVLFTSKTSVHDPINNTIAYTVTVKNNGNRPANDVVIFDGLPANTTLVSSGVSGLFTASGDTLDTSAVLSESALNIDLNADGDTTDADEAGLALDLNTDGDSTDANVSGLYAIDAQLDPSDSVSLTFTVSYDPATLPGGYAIKNVGYASGDTDEDGTPDSIVPSIEIEDVLDATYGVTIADTGIGASAGVNDGGDDDADATNNDQFVDQASAGSSVLFTNVITNTGNADDVFELTVAPGHNFPAGTVFTFFDQTGTVILTDSNSAGTGIDSGLVAAGTSKTIIVKATLPASASGDAPAPASEYEATISAVSANDTAATPAQDTVAVSLGTIVAAVADIHNASNGTIGVNEDPLSAVPYAAITTFPGNLGNTVSIPLYIDNESGTSDAYLLGAGSTWDGTTLGALPAGWTVEFFLGDGAGNPTGTAISTTPTMPAGQTNLEIIAVVTIPNDAQQAIDDFLFDNDVDGTDDTLDGNADGDGDYPIFFQITSTSTSATDITLDAIDVDPSRQISLVSPGTSQIEAGNTANYGHTLANNGNISEVIELTASNSQTGWSHTLTIDTNGDGVADTEISNLVVGQITVQQSNGVDIVVTITDTDSDGDMELTLEPGTSIPLDVKVFAPTNAPLNAVDTFTINATNIDTAADAPSTSVDDLTTIINGNVELLKTVAVDNDCDGTADTPFEETQSVGVEPDQCAIWQVTAENKGSVNANNVVITDATPDYSDFVVGSLKYCLADACAPAVVTDAPNDDAGGIVAGNIVFYVGTTSSPGTGEGGVLVPGQKATTQFSVKVQ